MARYIQVKGMKEQCSCNGILKSLRLYIYPSQKHSPSTRLSQQPSLHRNWAKLTDLLQLRQLLSPANQCLESQHPWCAWCATFALTGAVRLHLETQSLYMRISLIYSLHNVLAVNNNLSPLPYINCCIIIGVQSLLDCESVLDINSVSFMRDVEIWCSKRFRSDVNEHQEDQPVKWWPPLCSLIGPSFKSDTIGAPMWSTTLLSQKC